MNWILLLLSFLCFVLFFASKKNKIEELDKTLTIEVDRTLTAKSVLEMFPLVSAICVTRNRVDYLKTAIQDFIKQTYPNKELVIVYDSDDLDTKNFVAILPEDLPIKLVENRQKMKLGLLRNLGIDSASGTMIIQWDDDDEYHPERIEMQMKALNLHENKKACCLSRWIVHDKITNKSYLSNKRTWEGSILAPKTLLQQNPYPDLSREEDLVVINELVDKDLIFTVNLPELYIYTLHGKNTFDRNHGLGIIRQSSEISLKYPVLQVPKPLEKNIFGIYKCYVINLDTYTQRMDNVIKECSKYNLDVERIPAVNGKNLQETDHLIDPKKPHKLSKKEIGCYLSHAKAIKKIAADPENTLSLILEDDIEFRDTFSVIMQSAIHSLQNLDWDIIFLGCDLREDDFLTQVGPCIYTASLVTGTWAYMMTPKTARYILENIFPISYPIDLVLTLPYPVVKTKTKYDHRFDGNLKKFIVHTGDPFKIIMNGSLGRLGIINETSTETKTSSTSS